MKLNQLGLTKAGQKATKKLSHQVHKATVAAAMEPKMRLGVVGIEIGQEQSTGDTSRINESVSDWVMIDKMAKMLGIKVFHFIEGDFDRDEVTADAMKLMKLRKEDHQKFVNAMHALSQVANLLTGPHSSMFMQLLSATGAMYNFGFNPVQWVMDALEGNAKLTQAKAAIGAHAKAVEQLADFLVELDKVKSTDDGYGEYYKLINVFLRKLGVR